MNSASETQIYYFFFFVAYSVFVDLVNSAHDLQKMQTHEERRHPNSHYASERIWLYL